MIRSVHRSALAIALAFAFIFVSSVASADDGRYIVKFREGRSAAGRAALRAAGAREVLSLAPQDAVAARVPGGALAGLSRNPNIEYIEPDHIREPYATSLVETVPYGIRMVQADLLTSSDEGAKKVCIIDSGYWQQHEDLRDADSTLTQHGYDEGGSQTWDKDSCGHGTHVAGTVLATSANGRGVVGVVPGAQLHIVKVFGDDTLEGGNCSWTYSSTLVDALNKCEAAGANITSMSLGGSFKSRTEDTAFANAYKRGMLHIAAAGNGGNKTTSYPAGYASVVSVAAVDSAGTVASFSQQNKDVELAAPGVGVLSTVPWLDENTVTFADATSIAGGHIENSARTTAGVTGTIVDGGLCDSVGVWSGSIVVCQRGAISFYDKVRNVQTGGGAAAVIYNSSASDATCADFSGTLGDGNSSSIPAIGVSCQDGQSALAATGGTLVSQFHVPQSGYEAWNGTSMATPHVSGVAALVWSCQPGATNQAVRNALTSTAQEKGAAGRDPAYGYGIVQAKAAAQALTGPGFSCTLLNSSKY